MEDFTAGRNHLSDLVQSSCFTEKKIKTCGSLGTFLRSQDD